MRIGMLGLGFMGLTHLKGYKNIPGVEIAAVASNDETALTGDLTNVGGNLGVAGEKFDFSNVEIYRDSIVAARNARVDAVDICLPTGLHAPAAIAALEAGKHVLVEKPMALDSSEAEAMLAAARANGRILMCAQVLRFFPSYLPLIEAVQKGTIGAVRHALFRRRCAAPGWSLWLTDKQRSGGGVFDLLIHDIDMMVYLFGIPETMQAWGHEDLPKGIDLLTAQFHYLQGFSVTVTGGWHHPKAYPFSMEYTVVGDGGAIEYSSAGRDPKWYSPEGAETKIQLSPVDGYQAEIEYFVDCCRNGKTPERCTPESSAAVVRLARTAEEARARKGEVVSCKQ